MAHLLFAGDRSRLEADESLPALASRALCQSQAKEYTQLQTPGRLVAAATLVAEIDEIGTNPQLMAFSASGRSNAASVSSRIPGVLQARIGAALLRMKTPEPESVPIGPSVRGRIGLTPKIIRPQERSALALSRAGESRRRGIAHA